MSVRDSTRNRRLLVSALAVAVGVVLTALVLILISTRAYLAIAQLKWLVLLMGSVLTGMGLVFIAKARSNRSLPMSIRLIFFIGPGLGGLAFAGGLLCYGVAGDLTPGTTSLLRVLASIGEACLLTASAIALLSMGRRASRTTQEPVEGARRDGDAA